MKKFITLFLALVLTFSAKAQISESFEGPDFPPEGWHTAFVPTDPSVTESDSKWEISNLYQNNGAKSAYSNFDTEESSAWLITPQHTPTADKHMIYFYQRQFDADDDYGSIYTVRITSGEQDNLGDYITVQEHGENTFGEDFTLDSVDLSAYIDTPIFIAFVHFQADGDNWYIEDVRTQEMMPPGSATNPTPTDGTAEIEITNSQTSPVDLSWTAPTTQPAAEFYNIKVGSSSDDLLLLGSRVVTNAHPKTFHFGTTYYWQAVGGTSGGMDPDAPVWSFTTVNQPTFVAPYSIDFENEGFVPDGCDQLVENNEFWKFAKTTAHFGNAGDTSSTSTESGNYFAYVDDSSPNSENTSFLTAFVDVSSLNAPAFSFYTISHKEDASLNVAFSVTLWDGANWNEIFSSSENTEGWEKKDFDLSDLNITGPIQAKFIVTEAPDGGVKDDLAIDDISFYDASPDATHTAQSINGLAYFPNPIQDQLNIHANESIQLVQIFDVLGHIVLSQPTNNTTITINTSSLEDGAYVVKVSTNDKRSAFSLFK